ncbi:MULTISPECIES: hypothetical protein [Mycobacterium]|uniref:hypothetical protein n=1 Tax=Mycobacterium TaxID=1763 RepID=UPI001CD99C81|nr:MULTISPECIES: hypothetical protein [Mycobacterium]MCA2242216.1 hypothetical protein [Mycobacterium sp. WUMAC-067]MCA2313749.1 hypothetical protein [Mycobacterium sp. WUMAC-025]MEE3754832.1 hypothetical protein [Mycobacterium intracellulare]
MISYGADSWVWCGTLFNGLAVMLFLGVVITAVVLAIHVRDARRSVPSAGADGGFDRAGQVPTSPGARGDADGDDVCRRLM